jgi:hypothetical protein
MASLTYPKFVNGETAFHRDFNSHVWADHLAHISTSEWPLAPFST